MIAPEDEAVVERQLGRPPRAIHDVGHRCPCGLPDVIETSPRLPDGTPFPTLYYLTCPRAVAAVVAELDAAAGADQWFDRAVRELRAELRSREPRRARRMAELLALCLQGSLLLRHAPDEVAAAFVASRFLPDGPWRTAGTLPVDTVTEPLVARVTPRS